MNIIAWIILGAIAGYLAGFLVKGDEGLGVIGHIVLGIVGALVGGFLAGVLFNTQADRRSVRPQLDRRRDDRRDHHGRRRNAVTGRSRSGRGAIWTEPRLSRAPPRTHGTPADPGGRS